jgi:hypothetical protein
MGLKYKNESLIIVFGAAISASIERRLCQFNVVSIFIIPALYLHPHSSITERANYRFESQRVLSQYHE